MSFLVTGDLHLTANSRDEYRWSFLPWLSQQAHIYKVNAVWILGDLTDRKDCHPSTLVNRLVEGLETFRPIPIVVVMGNHDYIDEENPFFSFLGGIGGLQFIKNEGETSDNTVYAVPHSRRFDNPEFKFDRDWKGPRATPYPYVFVHGTITGAVVGKNMPTLRGIPKYAFHEDSRVLAGDIHVPQDIGGNITYVGAPYPINFDDTYVPRVILVDDHGNEKNLFPPSIQKRHLIVETMDGLKDHIKMFDLGANDQIKVTVELKRSDFHEWKTIRDLVVKVCTKSGVTLCSLAMRELKTALIKRERFDEPPVESSPTRNPFNDFCADTNVIQELMITGRKLLE